MTEILPFIIVGVVSGSLYGLAGMGLVLTYRTSGVFNFGYGTIAAGAAFLFYTLHNTHHFPWPVAAIITLGTFGLIVGWAMEWVTRSLGDAPEAVIVVATVGILLAVQGYLFLQYGNEVRQFPQFLPSSGFSVSGVNITYAQVISVAIAAASAGGLYLFLRQSRLGVAMRAVVDNPTLVALAGQSPHRVRLAAWSIGSVFAALAGILLAPTLGLDANLLTFLVVEAFGAAAIGMFKSMPLTYLGGLLVGVVASLATKYFDHPPLNGVPPSVPFLILVAILLAVPVSRFPRRRASLRSLLPTVQPMSWRKATPLAGVGVVAMVIVPQVVGTNLPTWTGALIDVIIFLPLALLVWTSGQISLCHASFIAVGAVTMAHMTADRVPWLLALVLAGLVSLPIGAIVAIPAIRLPGLYLALATLGFNILMEYVVYPTSVMFGQKLYVTAKRPRLGPVNAANDKQFYYLVLVLVIICLVLFALISRSRHGRLLRALSEAPTMLSTQGLSVNLTRLIVFSLSAFFAGIAGALAVTQFGTVASTSYGPINSLMLVTVLAICGTRLLRSSMLAAVLFGIVPGYVSKFGTNQQTFAFGVLAITASIMIAKREAILKAINQSFPAAAATRPLIRPTTGPPTVRSPNGTRISANGARVPAGMVR